MISLYENYDTLVVFSAAAGFTIEPTSGDIRFTGDLDRERQPIIYLTVEGVEVRGSDNSVETSLVGFASVQVLLGDVNDNDPTFFNYVGLSANQDNPYRSIVSEAVVIGHIILDDALAFDPDEVAMHDSVVLNVY